MFFFPLKHTSYLTNTWPLFIFDIFFFFKNDIPFFSGFGSGWLPEMHSCPILLPNAELGTGKASGLLYSTDGVLGFRHLPQHRVALSQGASPGGCAASPGGAHLEEFCLREHTWHLMMFCKPGMIFTSTWDGCLQLCSDLFATAFHDNGPGLCFAACHIRTQGLIINMWLFMLIM